jgi:hypothetical protein
MDCTDAYREALTRDYAARAAARAPAPVPRQRRAEEAGRDGAAGRALRRRTGPGPDDLEAAAPGSAQPL